MGSVLSYFRGLPTPKMILWAGGSTLALAFLTGLLIAEITSITRYTVQTIGFDTKPSVEASSVLRASLAGLYADIANEILIETKPGSTDDYVSDLRKVSDAIVAADKNITFDDEAIILKDMQRSLGHLIALVGEIRSGTQSEKTHKLVYFSNIEHLMLLASNLEKVNDKPLEDAFMHFQYNTKLSFYLALVLFVVFLTGLAALQFWLMKKTKRLINIPIFAASVIAMLSMGWTTYAMVRERMDVRTAKVASYNSLRDLYAIRAALFVMNSDESMWLLDKDHTFETTFFANAKRILDVEYTNLAVVQPLIKGLNSALDFEKQDDSRSAVNATPKINGWLGGEIGNITFGYDERKPATDATEYFIRYMQIDRQIRDLELKGDHKGAVALCIGSNEGQSDWVFEHLIAALDATIKANNDEFLDNINRSMTLLKMTPVISIGSLILIALLVWLGLRARYQEYT